MAHIYFDAILSGILYCLFVLCIPSLQSNCAVAAELKWKKTMNEIVGKLGWSTIVRYAGLYAGYMICIGNYNKF